MSATAQKRNRGATRILHQRRREGALALRGARRLSVSPVNVYRSLARGPGNRIGRRAPRRASFPFRIPGPTA